MRRILVSCAVLAVLALPAAASARARGDAGPGYLVVSKAVGDGGVHGAPIVTLIVKGFVLGRVSQEAQVQIVQLPSVGGQGAPLVVGTDVSSSTIKYRGRFSGRAYSGSKFRFRAIGGLYRVVVRGSGVYLFAGGHGHVTLRGSRVFQRADGRYAVDGGAWHSLPKTPVTRKIGGG
ncbi:MAG TPA: hypothetical protein VGM45_06455 [Gaiellaceae bacterium]|jgi:hypothetical protein